MTDALITPDILFWARSRALLSQDTLAQKAQVKADDLALWEKGEQRPSFRQAQKLAKKLRIPFGYLFISEPPQDIVPLPDLRTISDMEAEPLSIDFIDLLNDTLRKHQWYIDSIREEGAIPLDFVGSTTITNEPRTTADDICNTIGINEALRKEAVNWEDFLRQCIRRVEGQGILVLRSGVVGNNSHRKLSVVEFRGFTMCDSLAPLIFINGRDAKAAQIFTLAHELAHVWTGQSGISNPDLGSPNLNRGLEIEIFCNAVAAEVLVPREHFLAVWNSNIPIADNLFIMVRHYRVSSIVLLRRAFELNRITEDEFYEQYNREIQMQKPRRVGQEESGGDFYRTLRARNSNRLTGAILSATYEGRLLFRDAARLLGVKVKTLEGITKSMSG